MQYIRQFNQITIKDVPLVGGKTASLGQMMNGLRDKGITIPDGFAITADAYWLFVRENKLENTITDLLSKITDQTSLEELQKVGGSIRELIIKGTLPVVLKSEIENAYDQLSKEYKEKECTVAVRSSATAEDLPGASFAGQQETFLNVKGKEELERACVACFASLFTDRAITYRIEKKFDHMKIALSIAVQKMIHADTGCSGVMFTLDTESGFKDVIMINASWGLGEAIVQGLVTPDEFLVHKPTFQKGFKSLIKKERGSKDLKMVRGSDKYKTVVSTQTSSAEQDSFCLSDQDIFELARMGLTIEEHYSDLNKHWTPMDIEWAKDGDDGKLYIVQARPETVHAVHEKKAVTTYQLNQSAELKVVAQGMSIGQSIASGPVRIVKTIHDTVTFNQGDILVAPMTDPDWLPLMKKAAGLITQEGGRTSHAAIVSRELGIPAIVGAAGVLSKVKDGQIVTLDCTQGSSGYLYDGKIPFAAREIAIADLPKSPVALMINLAQPDRAFQSAWLPVDGVGLARTEFILAHDVRMHPMAAMQPEKVKDKSVIMAIEKLTQGYEDPKIFVVDTLAQGVGTIAAAFYPKPVIVRFSDFKTNEYRNLLGGSSFEPEEENPMLGLRGASRYYHPLYKEAFQLECQAMKNVREQMGLINVILMIPFVRTIGEAQDVVKLLKKNGLERGQNGLQLYMMCEIPSNVILIDEFSHYFDGFSIGSNDLTQFTLAVDRDSAVLNPLFDENDPAVKKMMELAIIGAHKEGKKIGICGQAPSDYPEIADFLIEKGIDSLSLNVDKVIPFLEHYSHEPSK